ncbi:alpha/beta hydrolase [Lacrimispora celerecrescens]|uniref:Lysophospholipase n=1 Tax=Lacrimispora celerecrescens TaxID=29354 RepID=A0A084JKU7_9FIRM|nr:alpha/beta hydrolase [Lacrimispora celerecrescens]KEZ89581.1 lysophospholipase [Lacrimispora celerecrescens]
MNYSNQTDWKKVAAFLPEKFHFTSSFCPNEEWWEWKGNKIHLDTFRNPDAKAKIILFHGVGTNGRQMSTIIGGPLAKDNFEMIAIDMPLYGMSVINQKKAITYDDWVQLGSDYIDYELKRDDKAIFLYGLSAGGMETYHVACKNKKVAGIIGMTFLDQRNQQVRNETANNAFWAQWGTPLAGISCKFGMGKLKMKMSICSKMTALCNDDDCLQVLLQDKTSAGNCVPMKFIYSYMTAAPEIDPESFDICPILLTQPSKDKWTPLHLSKPFLDKISKVPVSIKTLENGSHYPIEQPALDQLHEYILEFINSNLKN